MPTTQYNSSGLTQLSIGCLHLLLNRATLDFPTSHIGSPSEFVIITLTNPGPLEPRFKSFFPFSVRSQIWHTAVVPVLEDKKNQFLIDKEKSHGNAINLHLIDTKQWDVLIRNLFYALFSSLQLRGFLPSEEVDLVQSTSLAPGEPIRRIEDISISYQQLDC